MPSLAKVGAVVGTKTFTPIQTNLPLGGKMDVYNCSNMWFEWCLSTFFFIPHLKEDDLLEEDIKFKNYLIDHGWDGEFGLQGEPSKDE